MMRTVIVDTTDPNSNPVGPIKLIEPHDAIVYLAHGSFDERPQERIRPWYSFHGDDLDYEVGNSIGRQDLAEEMVGIAIQQGRLRCAFVVQTTTGGLGRQIPGLRLEFIDPEQFEGGEFFFGLEDEGYSIQVVKPAPDGEEHEQIETQDGFLFFWDEVAQMRPPKPGELEQQPVPVIESIPMPSALTGSMLGARGRLPAPTRGGGRPTKAPGAHAALTIKLLEATDEEFANFTVESAAMELQTMSGAHLDNCRKAARQIVQQVREHRESKS